MRRSMSGIAGAALTVALLPGFYAKNNNDNEAAPTPNSAATSAWPNHPSQELIHSRITDTAAQLLAIGKHATMTEVGKPPYSFTFSQTTAEGRLVQYSVQTATAANNPADAELLELQQTGRGIANFDLSIYLRDDGTENVVCETDPYDANGTSFAEIGNRTVEQNGQQIVGYDSNLALAYLGDELYNFGGALNNSMLPGLRTTALSNLCPVNFGDVIN